MSQFDKPYAGAWSFPSSKGTTTYECVLYTDGTTSCNCPGWTFAKKGKERSCKHTEAVGTYSARILTGRLRPEDVGGVSSGSTPLGTKPINMPVVASVSRLARMIVNDD